MNHGLRRQAANGGNQVRKIINRARLITDSDQADKGRGRLLQACQKCGPVNLAAGEQRQQNQLKILAYPQVFQGCQNSVVFTG